MKLLNKFLWTYPWKLFDMHAHFVIVSFLNGGKITDAVLNGLHVLPHCFLCLVYNLWHFYSIRSPEHLRLLHDSLILCDLQFMFSLEYIALSEKFILVRLRYLVLALGRTNKLRYYRLTLTLLLLYLNKLLILVCQTEAHVLDLSHEIRAISHILCHVLLLPSQDFWKRGG